VIKNNITEIKIKLILLFCGLIVFSPLSSFITMEILKLNFAFPELLFLPFYLALRKRMDLKVKITATNILLFFLFIFLLVLSFILQNFRETSILSTARGYFYMLLSFSIFCGKNDTSIQDIMILCLGSTIGWCLLGIAQFIQLPYMSDTESSLGVYGNMVTLALLICICIIYRNYKLVILSIFLGILLSFTTGLRRQIIVFVFSVLLAYAFIIFGRLKNYKRLFLILVIFTVGLVYSYPYAKEYVNNVSPLLQHRIFLKSEQFVKGEYSESDVLRADYINHFIRTLDEFMLPRGYVSKRTMEDKGTGIFMDLPFIELSYMLGLIVLTFFLIYFLKCIFNQIKRYLYTTNKESAIWATSAIILLVLLFIEGSNLNYAYIAPFTGLILGKLSSYKNVK
jgi:hypothetical protein